MQTYLNSRLYLKNDKNMYDHKSHEAVREIYVQV